MPTPNFKKRRSSRVSLDFLMVGALTALPLILAFTTLSLYAYGVVSAFKASVLTGLLFLIPPLGLVEGFGKLFFRYDVAMALKALAAANGVAI